MRMKRPQGYKTKRCKHNNKVRFHFRTLHRLKLEIEWPLCCDPKGGDESRPVSKFVLPEDYMKDNKEESGGRG